MLYPIKLTPSSAPCWKGNEGNSVEVKPNRNRNSSGIRRNYIYYYSGQKLCSRPLLLKRVYFTQVNTLLVIE